MQQPPDLRGILFKMAAQCVPDSGINSLSHPNGEIQSEPYKQQHQPHNQKYNGIGEQQGYDGAYTQIFIVFMHPAK